MPSSPYGTLKVLLKYTHERARTEKRCSFHAPMSTAVADPPMTPAFEIVKGSIIVYGLSNL